MNRLRYSRNSLLALAILLLLAIPFADSTRNPFLHSSAGASYQAFQQHGQAIISRSNCISCRRQDVSDSILSLSLRGGAQEDEEEDESDDDEPEVLRERASKPQTPLTVSNDEDPDNNEEDVEEQASDQSASTEKPLHSALSNEPVSIQVTTMLNCSVLDQSLEITAHRSRSVGFLKASLQKQLPGRPPVTTMQLKLGPRVLSDELLVDELMDDEDDEDEDDEDKEGGEKVKQLRLILDMIPPVDLKSVILSDEKLNELTPSQLLDAFTTNEAAMYQNALCMAQEEEQQAQDDAEADANENETESSIMSASSSPLSQGSPTLLLKDRAARLRRDMESKLLQSASSQAALAETIPPSHKTMNLQEREIRGQRIRQVAQGGVKTTLRRKIQRNFNVNWADTIRTICLFLFFGYFGGRSPTSRAILLLGAPSVVFLQARPVKIWLRQVIYFLLYHPPSIVLSLLPAPQQALLSVDVDQDMATLYGDYCESLANGRPGSNDDKEIEGDEDGEVFAEYDDDDDDED
jgi:hypothetical protein